MEKQVREKGQAGYDEDYSSKSADMSDTGLSELAYDWVTILHNKTKGLRAYATYIEDARKANAQECVDLLERIRDADRRMVEEIKDHVAQVLAGKMGRKTTKAAGTA